MTWMETHSNQAFDLASPRAEQVKLTDVALALAKLCRFAGHCRGFYSVAEHSMLVADILQAWGEGPQVQLIGLLHDAHEAYTGDLTRPMKLAMRESPQAALQVGYIEARVQGEIEVALLPAAMHGWADPWDADAATCAALQDGIDAVKRADTTALAIERRDLGFALDWSEGLAGAGPIPAGLKCHQREWYMVGHDFMRRYHRLYAEICGYTP
jgi:hypothetical protein